MRRMKVGAEDDATEKNRQTMSLAGLAVALAIVVAMLFLFYHLRDKARLEDCLLEGRRNCVTVPE